MHVKQCDNINNAGRALPNEVDTTVPPQSPSQVGVGEGTSLQNALGLNKWQFPRENQPVLHRVCSQLKKPSRCIKKTKTTQYAIFLFSGLVNLWQSKIKNMMCHGQRSPQSLPLPQGHHYQIEHTLRTPMNPRPMIIFEVRTSSFMNSCSCSCSSVFLIR